MSEFHVVVTQLRNIRKNPESDMLKVADTLEGYPIQYNFTQSDYTEQDKVVHVPIDSILSDNPIFESFGGAGTRVKAKRMRGIFSMGFVIPCLNPEWQLGQNVQEELGITKYETPEELGMGGENRKDPGFIPRYTDIEGFRKYGSKVLIPGEEVVITEKIHGANARFLYRDGELYVGSKGCIKKFDESNMWWKVVLNLDLEGKLKQYEGIVIYGEVFGQVQDLKYGAKQGEIKLNLFDALDSYSMKYLDYDTFEEVRFGLDLPSVPVLYRGAWDESLVSLSEGKTTVEGADHVREGFVVKPIIERYDHKLGRVILKMVGSGYLLRKEK